MRPPRSFIVYGWLRLLIGAGVIIAAGLSWWPAALGCLGLYGACWWQLFRIMRRVA